MFEYICDHVIPGCTHQERGDTKEAVREKALKHLHEHHNLDYLDEDMLERVDFAIMFSR